MHTTFSYVIIINLIHEHKRHTYTQRAHAYTHTGDTQRTHTQETQIHTQETHKEHIHTQNTLLIDLLLTDLTIKNIRNNAHYYLHNNKTHNDTQITHTHKL